MASCSIALDLVKSTRLSVWRRALLDIEANLATLEGVITDSVQASDDWSVLARLRKVGARVSTLTHSTNLNKSSTLHPRLSAIFKARTVEGTYIPFSTALMLFLETLALSDNSFCVKPAFLRSFSRLFRSFLWSLPKIISFRRLQLHLLILHLCLGKDNQQLFVLNQ